MSAGRAVILESAVTFALMISYAFFGVVIGTTLPNLLAEFSLPISRGGLFTLFQYAGCLLGILGSGALLDRFGKRRVTLVAYGLFACAMIATSLTGGLAGYLAVLLVMGAAAKLFEAGANSRISALHENRKGGALNLLHCCYCFGALIGPIIIGLLLRGGFTWRTTYLSLGLLCLALFALYGYATTGKSVASPPSVRVRHQRSFGALLRPRMLCLTGMIFLCGGYEAGMNNWLPTFAAKVAGADVVVASSSLSWFWLGLMASRLLCTFLTRVLPERTLLPTGGLLGGLVLLLSVLFIPGTMVYAGFFGAGFFAGATLPMILTLGYTWCPGAHGRVSMLLFTSASVGAMAVPWIMGVVAERFGLRYPLVASAGCLLVISLLGLLLTGKDAGQD